MRIHRVDHCAPLPFAAVSQQRKMRLFSFDRSTAAQSAAITLVTVGALALLALVAAHWTWQWLAPHAESRGQQVANGVGHAGSAKALFGNAARDDSSPSSTGIGISLLGIVAATAGGRGYAVLRLEPKALLTVREGEDIAPGLRLAEVAVDHVILERGEARESLGWPARSPSAVLPVLKTGT